MTGEQGPESGRGDVRWTLDEVADAQAGVHQPDESAGLLAEIDRDPQARRMLGALRDVVDQLAHIPAPRMPVERAARLEAAIAAEARTRVVPAQRSAPPSMGGELSLLVAAASTAPSRVADQGPRQAPPAPFPGRATTATSGGAVTGAPAEAFALDPADLGAAYPMISGRRSGMLMDPETYASCLAAHGLHPHQVLGVSDVTYQGRQASALVVAETPATARVLVVGPDRSAAGISGSALLNSSGSIPR